MKRAIILLMLLTLPVFAADLNITNGAGGVNLLIAPPLAVSAPLFDGVNDSINLGTPTDLQFTTAFTIMAWVKPVAVKEHTVYANAANVATAFSHGVYIAPLPSMNLLVQVSGNGSTAIYTQSPYTIPTNHATHVAGVYDGGAGRLEGYVNGQDKTGTVNGGAIPASLYASQTIFDGYTNGYGAAFSGQIWDIRLYNRALSASEILQSYEGAVITSGLVAWLPCQEGGVSDRVYDVIGTGGVYGQVQNAVLSTFWSTTQTRSQYGRRYGYEKYTDTATGTIEIDVPLRRDGTAISPTITNYTKRQTVSGVGITPILVNVDNTP